VRVEDRGALGGMCEQVFHRPVSSEQLNLVGLGDACKVALTPIEFRTKRWRWRSCVGV
jgi:hypothetical protein